MARASSSIFFLSASYSAILSDVIRREPNNAFIFVSAFLCSNESLILSSLRRKTSGSFINICPSSMLLKMVFWRVTLVETLSGWNILIYKASSKDNDTSGPIRQKSNFPFAFESVAPHPSIRASPNSSRSSEYAYSDVSLLVFPWIGQRFTA